MGAVTAHAQAPTAYGNGMPLVQINVAGAEFSPETLPGQPGVNFFFPDSKYFEKWQSRGIRVIRFPLLWERLQPSLNSPLDSSYAKLVDKMLSQAAARNIGVILDVHNYGRYKQRVLGSGAVPLSTFKNLWRRMAERWHDNPGVLGYDLMNEPYGDADTYWPAAAQAGIDGVRLYDSSKPIYVEGRSWSSAARWPDTNGPLLLLRDPANNLIFSAHLYLDADASGSYTQTPSNIDEDIGVTRAQPFVNWLVRNNRRGHIGESGIPPTDTRWVQAMQNLLAYLKRKCVPMAYWAAGPMWGSYPLSIEPQKNQDRPQWAPLGRYIRGGNSCN
jgi:endoglucanase